MKKKLRKRVEYLKKPWNSQDKKRKARKAKILERILIKNIKKQFYNIICKDIDARIKHGKIRKVQRNFKSEGILEYGKRYQRADGNQFKRNSFSHSLWVLAVILNLSSSARGRGN